MAVQDTATGEDGKFDLLDDHCLSCTAKEVDERVLWLHGAPPCHTFTFARRTDKHGKVPILRDPDHPEGWGQPEVEEANALAERMAALQRHTRRRYHHTDVTFDVSSAGNPCNPRDYHSKRPYAGWKPWS